MLITYPRDGIRRSRRVGARWSRVVIDEAKAGHGPRLSSCSATQPL